MPSDVLSAVSNCKCQLEPETVFDAIGSASTDWAVSGLVKYLNHFYNYIEEKIPLFRFSAAKRFAIPKLEQFIRFNFSYNWSKMLSDVQKCKRPTWVWFIREHLPDQFDYFVYGLKIHDNATELSERPSPFHSLSENEFLTDRMRAILRPLVVRAYTL